MEDRIIENHVTKWMKSVDVLDANLTRFEDSERKAYTTIRNIFSKNRPNMEVITNNVDTLQKYLDEGVKDEVYTAVRDFLKTTEIAKDNFQAFKDILEDKGFFGTSISGNSGFEGASVGAATYRRVEIDGDIYEGMFLGNERVWRGKITYQDGIYYEGEWDNNGPHGEGIMTVEGGEKYIGRFSDEDNGKGRIEWPDGGWFEGAWNEDGPNGVGVMNEDGVIYKGEWRNGERAGKGRIEWSNDNWYEGGWNEDGAHGNGVWQQGERTDRGEYSNGRRIGEGRMDWADGNWYEGGWNESGPHGHGVFKIGDRIDKGNYKDGSRTGLGRIEWDNGDWYEGGWNENGKHGKGKQYVASCARVDEGEWENNVEVGTVMMKWKNGNTYKGTWHYDEKGNLSGVGEHYFINTGRTRSGEWINGKWNNDWATARNIISIMAWGAAVICVFSGVWLVGIGLGIFGKFIYEGV